MSQVHAPDDRGTPAALLWVAIELSEMLRSGLTVTLCPEPNGISCKVQRSSSSWCSNEVPCDVPNLAADDLAELTRRAAASARRLKMIP